ncbi:MAG TPA: AsmA family protein, partial [Luteimonas sp.]|nr:AsmA family protein [Luteimonas sp.]
FKKPVEHYVLARTGRHLVIGGNLGVDLGRTTTIRADRITFGNATWSKTPDMASADRVEFDVHLWPLLHRDVEIPNLRLTHPKLLLETGPGHVGNWVLPSSGGKGPQFNQVWIDQGHLQVTDAVNRTGLDVDVNSRNTSDNQTPTIDVAGKGLWKGADFSLKGIAESPLALRDTNRPYRIDMHLAAGPTRAHARGRLLDPLRLRDFDLQLAIAGSNMADLYPLIGVATPPTPAYQLDGRLGRNGDVWHYDNFKGHVGSSDLAGSASIDHGRDRPKLTANLVSRHMDIADLGGFLGVPPGRAAKGTAAAPSTEAHAPPAGKLLPDTEYNLAKLRSMDADVRLKVEHLNATTVPLDDMDGHLFLDAGVLRLDPLNFGVAGGTVHTNIRMDAREKVAGTNARIQARGLDLSKLIPSARFGKTTIGRVGGDMTLQGSGNSIAHILGNANGEADIGMGQGAVSKLLMKLSGLDITGAAKVLLTGDEQIPIRCGMGDFAVRDGVMTTHNLVVDTSDNTIFGQGNVSLKDESLVLQMTSRSKRFSLVSLRGPILVTGTLRDPSLHPDYKRVGLRAAAAAAIAIVAAPVAALAATIEGGKKQEIQCGKYGDTQPARTTTH